MAELVQITEEEKIKRRLLLTPTERYKLFLRLHKLGKIMQKTNK